MSKNMVFNGKRLRKDMIGKPVMVTWVDATTHWGWDSLDHYKSYEPEKASTVGFLLSMDKNKVSVISTMAPDSKAANGVFTIPRDWVQVVKVLR